MDVTVFTAASQLNYIHNNINISLKIVIKVENLELPYSKPFVSDKRIKPFYIKHVSYKNLYQATYEST